jgi:EAL domain-containing protein (putative c-di-GMP-specific phosphodiesterase class I)
VVLQSLAQQQAWSKSGRSVPVVVNVPARALENEAMLNQVEIILAEQELPAGSLALDISEQERVQDCERLEQVLTRLRKAGVWINLEHMGSGDSSLTIIKRLPLDGLKIPRGLVRDLPGSERDTAVVEALVRMGHALGLVVTAVGVETDEQADCLRSLGCDWAQGRWVSDPISPEFE